MQFACKCPFISGDICHDTGVRIQGTSRRREKRIRQAQKEGSQAGGGKGNSYRHSGGDSKKTHQFSSVPTFG